MSTAAEPTRGPGKADESEPQPWWQQAAGFARRFLPTRDDYPNISRTWTRDVLAGVTVAVVALPLALAFGVASGMGATAGLVTAVVAGAIAAIFGGSNFQVSGPTGAMTVVLVPLVATHGQSAAITVAVLAGILVIAMGLLNLGRVITLIPWPVIEGFTVGIALIIALQQIPYALGVSESYATNTALNAVISMGHLSASAIPDLTIAVVTVVLIVLIARIRRSLPASLMAIIATTTVVWLSGAHVTTVGVIPHHLPAPMLPELSPATVQTLFGSAVAVAILAAIESLLSAKVADGMADGRPTATNRELFGQGLANVGSGLFGGMPATGAIARTAVNVRAGATSRLSAIVHSLILLLIILVAANLVAQIPLAALGGVLLVTAYRMVEPRTISSLLGSSRSDRAIFLATAAATIAFDLILAIEIGVVLAAVVALVKLSRTSTASQEPLPDLSDHISDDTERALLRAHIVVYRIDGSMFFAVAQRFLDQLTAVSDVRVVILRMSGVGLLDASGAQALYRVVADLNAQHIVVIFKGLQPEHELLLEAHNAIGRTGEHRHSYASMADAIEHARTHLLLPNEARLGIT